MRSSVLVVLILLVKCGSGQAVSSHESSPGAINQDDLARIVGYSMTSGGASKFLETLTDTIGGRITGSPECKATADLILQKLKDAGFETAHFEEYTINPGWQHGPATGEVISPVKRDLYIASYGWAPGTPGAIEVPVADIGGTGDGHSPLPDRVRGAAVLVDLGSNGLSTNYVATRHLLARQLANAGAAAMFIVSDKPDRMLYTSAFLIYPRGPLPIISIAKEDAAFLRRLLSHGPVTIRLNVQNSFSSGPVPERNVVADLVGRDPSEMVLLTAHFDSWDPAQGANDNGGEVATVLEAARVLKFLKIQPRHTIRFVFFSGEEQSDLGSRAYVAQHKQELDGIRAVFNSDAGVQPPIGFKLYGRTDLEATTRKLISPLAPLGAERVFTDADFDSDEESFMVVGVPAYSLAVEPEDYYARHHTIIDTFERVDPRMLSLHTAVLAAVGYTFANSEERPGRRLTSAEVKELLQRTNLESLYELDYPDAKAY
ncbi:MAG TPA: M20/M25/M40 family metallo-hydrolase [Candidatus Acidoferrales bacterium]|nr:M20/M25/M40 family metallo-hydrolase [Candidatus Acidoferrales bacterium]